ncbi:MAG TPA: hypothetical protein VKK79_01820 [Candidatus Lokiarchaeia archaeon]|nr:hypothetical protein [Candidatus Lokiarchaeia archaeon]
MDRKIAIIGGGVTLLGTLLGFWFPGWVLWYSASATAQAISNGVLGTVFIITSAITILGGSAQKEKWVRIGVFLTLVGLAIVSVLLPFTSQNLFQPTMSDQSTNPNILPSGQAPVPLGVVAVYWGAGFWIALAGGVITMAGFAWPRAEAATQSPEIPEGVCIIDADLSVVKASPECDDDEILEEQKKLLEEGAGAPEED